MEVLEGYGKERGGVVREGEGRVRGTRRDPRPPKKVGHLYQQVAAGYYSPPCVGLTATHRNVNISFAFQHIVNLFKLRAVPALLSPHLFVGRPASRHPPADLLRLPLVVAGFAPRRRLPLVDAPLRTNLFLFKIVLLLLFRRLAHSNGAISTSLPHSVLGDAGVRQEGEEQGEAGRGSPFFGSVERAAFMIGIMDESVPSDAGFVLPKHEAGKSAMFHLCHPGAV